MAPQSPKHAATENGARRISLGVKLYGIIGFTFLCFIALTAYQLFQLKNTLETQRTTELKHLTEFAVGIVKEEYAASQAGSVTAEEAKRRAAARVGKIRYGHNDYFWINDLEPRMVMHPTKPELNGKSLVEVKDPQGVALFVEFVRIAKQSGSGFVNYSWPKPGADKPQPKTSYAVLFEPWGWIIATGLYIDDLHQQVWDQALSELAVIGLVLLLSAALVIAFIRSISKALASMTLAMGQVADGDLKVDIPAQNRNDELGAMSRALSAMVGTLEKFTKAQLEMARAHKEEGHIGHSMPESEFSGAYRTMAHNLNDMVMAHVEVQTHFVDLMVEYTNCHFGNRMVELPGEWRKISDAAEKIRGELEAANAAQFNAQVKAALDAASSCLMMADNDGLIRYQNKACNALMHGSESEFRTCLPGFSAAGVIGSNFDQFHKIPSKHRNLLANLKGEHRTQIQIGALHMRLVANIIADENGNRLGSVVEWLDRTAEVKAEKEIAGIVEAAAAGDFGKRIEEAGKAGFMLQMAHGLNTVLGTSEQALGEISRILKSLAQGDLSQTIEADFKGVFADLKDNSNSTIDRLRGIIQQIREATESLNTAAREIALGNNDLSRRTEDQASSLEETAASVEELSSTVRLNAENASQANRLASEASESARRGGEVVTQVVATMSGITESNREIADITTLIDGIAFQTNLLALNAAVEAARAGEQGRGFAIVASEVRALAQRAADAAHDIKAVIAGSVGKVEEGAKLVQSAGAVMEEIVTQVRRVTAIMGEIAAASKEQSAGVEQVNVAIVQIDNITQQNAALVEEATAAARSMEEQSQALVNSVAVFKLVEDRGGQRHEERPHHAGKGAANSKALH